MTDFMRILIYIAIAGIITAILVRQRKDKWYVYHIKADVIDGPMERPNFSPVHHLEEDCYFPFKIETMKDVRKAERVLTRRYRTKVVKIREAELIRWTLQ